MIFGLGQLVYGIKRRFGHGLRVAYYRDVVRPRILKSEPITGLTDSRCEIHVLTSQHDWLNLVWTLKSLYWASQRRYRLCLHDDGTLTESDVAELKRQFPDARMIRRSQADAEVLPALAAYPRCLAFRETNHLSPKVFDFRHYLAAERMLLLDSDVLFFTEPTELLRRIEDPNYRLNSVNADVSTSYTVQPAEVKQRLGFELPELFNSGLGVIHRDSMRPDWIEEFLGLPGIIGHFWRIEQTIFALCSAKYGVELLPREYRIMLGPSLAGCVAKHYVGVVRHLMYREGMACLVRQGMLNGRRSPPVPQVRSAS